MYSYSGIQLTEHTLSLRCSFASELLKSLAQQERLLVRDHWTRPFLIPINPEVFCSGNYKGNLNILILVQDLNKFMSKRVYLVGHELTLADIMLYYALHPVMLELTVHGKEQLINLSRWFNQVLFHPRRPRGSQLGREKRLRQKFSITGERAPGYRLSPNYFQKFKQMPPPDWAQKVLCIIVPNRRTVSPEFFSWVRTRRLLSLHTCLVRSPSLCVQGKLIILTFLTRNEGTTEESKKHLGCYQQKQFNLPREYPVFDRSHVS